MLATHRGSPAGIIPTADAMTPATASASHGPSVSIGRRAGAETDACAQPDPATHRASPTAFSAPALAMTPAAANAGHGSSVSLEAGRYECSAQQTIVHLDTCSTAATNVHLAALALDPERLQSGDRARYILSMERPGFVGVVRNGGEIRLYCDCIGEVLLCIVGVFVVML
jgi:hypothetical protein